MPALHLATFSADVTPPEGHPLCGGWIEPARGVDDPLRALGVVLLGMGQPIVLCVLDWTGIRNEAFFAFRQALAEAAHTVPSNVAVHCVHPHNAPFADVGAEQLIEAAPMPNISLDLKFFARAVKATADAARAALARTTPFTQIGFGRARVTEVASNRRIVVDGKAKFSRTSATRNKEVRDYPEGLIDPWLKTLSFWNGDQPIAGLHYYATHPMSYYGDGRVSADFCGLARQKFQDETKVFQAYFTGCSGNVTAGKYNDGARENRAVLRDKICSAMKESWKATQRFPIDQWKWRIEPVKFSPRNEKNFSEEESRKVLEDPKQSKARRNNAAYQIAWLKRIERPIELTCLDLGRVMVLHLPGEPFIEYQLKAQELRKDRHVCVAGYGDDGLGYIPTARAFLEGGYEPSVALAAPCEELLHRAMAKLLQAEKP